MKMKNLILSSLFIVFISPVNVFASNNNIENSAETIISNIMGLFKQEKEISKKRTIEEEKISLTLADKKKNEYIEYSVFQNGKWSSYFKEDKDINVNNNIEGIKIRLKNNREDRGIIYRIKTTDNKYSSWVTENVIAGEIDSGKYLRDIEIKVVDTDSEEYTQSSKPKIAIDMGHNIPVNAGATGIVQEDVVIKEVGEKVIEQLREKGYNVVDVLPETANTINESLQKRVNKSEINESDIFISIHFNSSPYPNAKGTEVFYASEEGSKELSQNIVDNIAILGFENRGIKDGETGEKPLYVLTKTDVTAALIECAFVSSREDIDLYDPTLMATSISNGIIKYINDLS